MKPKKSNAMKTRLKQTLILLSCFAVVACQGKNSDSRPIKGDLASPDQQMPGTNQNEFSSYSDTAYNIAWEFSEHDFGQVTQGEHLEVDFTFTVIDGQAQITGSRTYCGCTVPGWEPIFFYKGESYSLKVEFNTENKMGPFSETIDLYFNRSNTPEKIGVKGFVNPKK